MWDESKLIVKVLGTILSIFILAFYTQMLTYIAIIFKRME